MGCPPVVGYGAELQARAAVEVDALPAGSAVADLLSDYAVMRDQARATPAELPTKLIHPAPDAKGLAQGGRSISDHCRTARFALCSGERRRISVRGCPVLSPVNR
jgi:hypothetical protein